MALTKIQTASIAANAITATKIADGTVVAADIADGSVTTAKVADGNITAVKLGTIYTANISDIGTIATQDSDNITFSGSITEAIYTLGTSGSIALDPANGTIQTCTLSGDPTFTDSLSAGQTIVLMLLNGASQTVTWPTTTWVTSTGNAAPTLTANDTLVFWKISTTLYGAYVGSYA